MNKHIIILIIIIIIIIIIISGTSFNILTLVVGGRDSMRDPSRLSTT